MKIASMMFAGFMLHAAPVLADTDYLKYQALYDQGSMVAADQIPAYGIANASVASLDEPTTTERLVFQKSGQTSDTAVISSTFVENNGLTDAVAAADFMACGSYVPSGAFNPANRAWEQWSTYGNVRAGGGGTATAEGLAMYSLRTATDSRTGKAVLVMKVDVNDPGFCMVENYCTSGGSVPGNSYVVIEQIDPVTPSATTPPDCGQIIAPRIWIIGY